MQDKKKVLLVEDDSGVRRAVSSLLETQGYAVNAVPGGEEALKQVDKVDVVLLDMTNITGDEFMRRIRSKGNMVPVVLMSGIKQEKEAMDCFKEFKAIDYVVKPLKSKDLIEKVDRAASIADDLSIVKHTTDRLKGFISRQAAL